MTAAETKLQPPKLMLLYALLTATKPQAPHTTALASKSQQNTAPLPQQTIFWIPVPLIEQTCRPWQPTQTSSPRHSLYAFHYLLHIASRVIETCHFKPSKYSTPPHAKSSSSLYGSFYCSKLHPNNPKERIN
jgi:hypothetical protein